jgi:hypothetical protein
LVSKKIIHTANAVIARKYLLVSILIMILSIGKI